MYMGYPDSMWSTAKPTGFARLPQELIDLIVDNLAHDSVALRSCSFSDSVKKALYPPGADMSCGNVDVTGRLGRLTES